MLVARVIPTLGFSGVTIIWWRNGPHLYAPMESESAFLFRARLLCDAICRAAESMDKTLTRGQIPDDGCMTAPRGLVPSTAPLQSFPRQSRAARYYQWRYFAPHALRVRQMSDAALPHKPSPPETNCSSDGKLLGYRQEFVLQKSQHLPIAELK